jgi:hypothetical protein
MHMPPPPFHDGQRAPVYCWLPTTQVSVRMHRYVNGKNGTGERKKTNQNNQITIKIVLLYCVDEDDDK